MSVLGGNRADLSEGALTAGAATPAMPGVRFQAVRQVAMLAADAEDCASILAQLGLEPSEGVSPGGVS